ncbi:sensor histidine kinase [Streptomyces sp. NPDC001795]|uniref:sensor histidine kinase n=1 Tax=unclassified Streptomyces TaxID=2593676 RepID=UPI00332B1D58
MLRDDLWTVARHPLPPLSRPRLLRWLPHVLVLLLAVELTGLNTVLLQSDYQMSVAFALAVALMQGTAVGLALWRPVPAWWLSSFAAFLAAEAVRPRLSPSVPMGIHYEPVGPLPAGTMISAGVPWPWTPATIAVQALVLFLLALRMPTRVAVEALALTVASAYVIEGLVGEVAYSSTGVLAVVVFVGVVLLGMALRGRREARTQLVELTTVTAEERARRALLEERNRIARELHDVVAHHMSVISIQAQVAPHLVENPPDELKENLDGIRKNALEALTELRRVLGVLRSENPEDPYGIGSGSGAAPDSPQPTLDRLDALVENTRAAGLEVLTEITGEVRPLSPGVELSAYRIIQEALSNALRHAPGSTVRVELAYFPRGLQVRVINSRPTRPAPLSPGAGHGLLGMRERAVMLGGTLVTSETSCGGFAVACFLPSPKDPPPDDDPTPATGEEKR